MQPENNPVEILKALVGLGFFFLLGNFWVLVLFPQWYCNVFLEGVLGLINCLLRSLS